MRTAALPSPPPGKCPTAGGRKIESLPPGDLAMRQKAAEALLLKMGITFNVYGRDEGTEKIMPFDIIPRIVSGATGSRSKRVEAAHLRPQ
jgi:uncharacterized circularly permuted ATP-grasp superfamily protein